MTTNSRRIKLNHKRVARINSSYFSSPSLRKRVYASSLATFAVKAFFEEQSIKIIEGEAYSDNFYLLESLDLSDIKLNNSRIDVRCSINKPFNQIWIPKKPYKLGYRFDFFVAVVLYPEKEKSEIAGYISFEEIKDIIFSDTQNENYFILDAELLHPIEDLPAKLLNIINSESIPTEINNLEHGIVEELFVNFLDNTLTSKELKYLENHLINCDECKEKLANLYLFDQKIKLSPDPRHFLQEDIPIPKETPVFEEINKEEPQPETTSSTNYTPALPIEIPSITESKLYETIEKPINPIETAFSDAQTNIISTAAEFTTTSKTEELQIPTLKEQEIVTTTPELQEDQLTTPAYEENIEPPAIQENEEGSASATPHEEEAKETLSFSPHYQDTSEELTTLSETEEPDETLSFTPHYQDTSEELATLSEAEEPDETLSFTPHYQDTSEELAILSETEEPDETLSFIPPYQDTSEEFTTLSETEEPEKSSISEVLYNNTQEPESTQDFTSLDNNEYDQINYSETYEPPLNENIEEDDIYYEEPKADSIDSSIPHYLHENELSTFNTQDNNFENKLQDVSFEDYDNDGLSLIPEYLISPTEESYKEITETPKFENNEIEEQVIQVESILEDNTDTNYIENTTVEEIKPVNPIENEIQQISTPTDDTNIYGDFAQSSITFSDSYESKGFEEHDIPENTFNIEEDKQSTSEKVTRIEDYIKKHKSEIQEEETKETKPVELASKKRKKKLPIALVASFAVLAGVLVAGTVSIGLLTSKPAKDLIAINKQPTDELKDIIEQQSKGKSLGGTETNKNQNISKAEKEPKETLKKESPSTLIANTKTQNDKKVTKNQSLSTETNVSIAKPATSTQIKQLASAEKQKDNRAKSAEIKPENTISANPKAVPGKAQDKKLQGKVVLNKNASSVALKTLPHKEIKAIKSAKAVEKESKVTKHQQEPIVKKHITPVKQDKKEVKKASSSVKQKNKVEIKQKTSTKKTPSKINTRATKENTSKKAKDTNKKHKETLIAMNSPAPPIVLGAARLEHKQTDEIVKPVSIASSPTGSSKARIKANNYDINTSGAIKSFKKDGKSQAYAASESKPSSKDLLANLSEKDEALKFNPNPVDVSVNDSVASANILWKPTSSTQIPNNLSSFVNSSVQRSKSNLNQAFKKNNISGQFQTVVILIKINNSKKTVTPIIASSSGSSKVDNIILSSVRKGFLGKSIPSCEGSCDNIEIKLSIVM